MKHDIWQILKIRPPTGTNVLPVLTTQAQCMGIPGISYVFVICSHALVLMTGVLAIAGLRELAPPGVWRRSDLAFRVSALAALVCDVAEAAERTLGQALSNLAIPSNGSFPSSEVKGMEDIRLIGEVYASLLKSVASETRRTATQHDLSESVQSGPLETMRIPASEAKEIDDSICTLTEQVIALGVRIEMLEHGCRSKGGELR